MKFPSKLPGASMIGDEELAELTDVIRSRSPFRFYGIGSPDKVATFESEAKRFLGCSYTLAVNSGSSALYCAVVALGITTGDEVIIPAFTWFSDFTSVLLNGAEVVFTDIDESLNLDPDDFERKITDRTKAVIVVHYQGGPANLDRIVAIAEARGISIIEDCAQAFGGEYHGRKLGTIGRIGITSFQGNKMITAGEGGLVYTNEEPLFARAVRCHDNGSMRDYFAGQIEDKTLTADSSGFPGLQFRMSELQGAVLLAQLRKLPGLLERCRGYHEILRREFSETGLFEIRPHVDGDCGITFFFRFADEETARSFEKRLEGEGVPIGPSSGCTNILKTPMIADKRQLQPSFPPASGERPSRYDVDELSKATDAMLARYVAIGIGPLYTQAHIDFIVEGMKRSIASVS